MNYSELRKRTRKVMLGRDGTEKIYVGGDSPVSVQSMLNVPTDDFDAVLKQTRELEKAGADIVRLTVPRPENASVFSFLRESGVRVPLVADIHFDYKAAIESVAAGADKIRINPGNIGSEDRIKAVVSACRENSVPIRIGVNSGSLEKNILAKYGAPTSEALYESAMYHVSLLRKFDFDDIVISVKSSDLCTMIGAYRMLSDAVDYPLHLGVTEAGTKRRGVIKSAVGIGSLLCDGIGDTIRVSLTADPVEEIYEGRRLLDTVGISEGGIEVVSCPTCGRTAVDLISLVNEFESRSEELNCKKRIKVAIMGCAVNGPGEAREADFGVACGDGCGLIFEDGEIIRKVKETEIIETLLNMCVKYGSVKTY